MDWVSTPPPNSSLNASAPVVSFPTVALFSINSVPVRKDPMFAAFLASAINLEHDSFPIPVASERVPGACVPIASRVS